MGLAGDWMDQMVTSGTIVSARVSTRQPSYLSLCLDYAKDLSVESYLFEARQELPIIKRPMAGLVFELARREEIKACKDIVGEPYPGYLKNLYDKQGLYVLRLQNEILAMGEVRLDEDFPSFADLGMATAPAHRRKGMAACMVSNLLTEIRRRGLTANASCDSANIGSRKTLEKAGMVASHRILKVSF
jgi:RimJ/RimL family protein N-acetyltransferase